MSAPHPANLVVLRMYTLLLVPYTWYMIGFQIFGPFSVLDSHNNIHSIRSTAAVVYP